MDAPDDISRARVTQFHCNQLQAMPLPPLFIIRTFVMLSQYGGVRPVAKCQGHIIMIFTGSEYLYGTMYLSLISYWNSKANYFCFTLKTFGFGNES